MWYNTIFSQEGQNLTPEFTAGAILMDMTSRCKQ